MRRASISALVALLLIAGPGAQQPTFKSGVQLIEVDVRVFDRDGRFVVDLTRDDFEVLESGVAQPLQTVFLVGEASPVARDADAVPADAGPRARATAESPRQTWIFFFDLNHLTPGGSFDRARKAVEEFIGRRFTDGDLGGVVAGSKMVNNRLTSVRAELVKAAAAVKPIGDARNRQIELTREWPKVLNDDEALRIVRGERDALNRAITRACTEDPDACRRVPPDMQIQEKARRFATENQRAAIETLTAVNALASGLARIAGPKTIVFLTDGFVTQAIETTLRNVVGQTARAGGRVYAIDVRGLNRGSSTSNLDQLAATDEAGPASKFDIGEDGPNSLAVDTGGLMIRNENNIGRALDRIADDSGRYYVIGYQPANANFDGKYRPIDVRVKRPGVRVRARRGYLALEPSKMLTPQPVKSGSPEARKPDSPRETATREPASEHSATTVIGTIVSTPPPASAGSATRLRPNAEERIKELAGAETASASDLAKNGWEAYQRGDVESAVKAFTGAAAVPNVRPWVLYALGLSQVALGRPADAAVAWERVRATVPEFEPVYIDLADSYLQMSDLTKALAVLRAAEARWPKDEEVHNAIGVIHYRRGALDDSIAAFARATEVAPGDALGHFNLGRAYEVRFARGQRYVSSQRRWVAPQEDLAKAEESYQRCVKLGGPYALQAAEGINRLQWSKKGH